MKQFLRISSFVCCTMILCSCSLFKHITKCTPQTYNLAQIEKTVQRQYKEALDELKGGNPSIELVPKEATLKVAITDARSASGSLEVLIVQGSYKYTKTKQTTVTVSYKPVEDKTGGGPLDADTATLKNLIVKAAKEFYTLAGIGTLKKQDFEIEASFTIEKDKSGGFKFKILGADIDASAEQDCSVEQTFSMKFGIKE